MGGTALYSRPLVHLTGGMMPGALYRTFHRTQAFSIGCMVPLLQSSVFWPLRIRDLQRARRLYKGKANYNDSLSKDTIFVVGFWRSATTLLHELLSLDPNVGFPNLI